MIDRMGIMTGQALLLLTEQGTLCIFENTIMLPGEKIYIHIQEIIAKI